MTEVESASLEGLNTNNEVDGYDADSGEINISADATVRGEASYDVSLSFVWSFLRPRLTFQLA
jgi:hypothetical protein